MSHGDCRHRAMSHSAAVIRPYRRMLDARETHDVFRGAVLGSASRDYTPEQIVAWAGAPNIDLTGWDDRRATADTFVAVVNGQEGQIVGFGDLRSGGLVDMLFVRPEFSGRGIARLLVEAVKRRAAASGITTLCTYASRTARPAFEQFGFAVVTDRPDNVVGGVIVPNYEMRCDLESSRR